MAFLTFCTIFCFALLIWSAGPEAINEIGSDFFAISILSCVALALFVEVHRKRFSILCFPLAGGVLFIWGLFGPYCQLEVLGEYVYYNHLRTYLIPQAMALALVAFSCMWVGHFFPVLRLNQVFNPVVYRPTNQNISQLVFLGFLILWVALCLIHVGGISGLLYNDQPRAYDQFFLTNVRRNVGLAIRFLAVILGFMSIILFLGRKTGKLSWASWFILVFWFLYALSQYDRGKFLETAIVILGAYFMTLRRFRARQGMVALIIAVMCAAILVNANGRLYGKTGLLTIPEAVSYGVENKIKDPYSIFPEVGALVMTTTAIELYNDDIRRPISDVLYQVNPLPSFLMPASWRPDFFIERLLGAFGSSGVPMPLLAFCYMSFGVFGCVFFGALGLYFRALAARIRYIKTHAGGLPDVIGIFIYPVSLTGVTYTFAHGEPRGSIRMVVYSFIILTLLRQAFPNHFLRLNKAVIQEKAKPFSQEEQSA